MTSHRIILPHTLEPIPPSMERLSVPILGNTLPEPETTAEPGSTQQFMQACDRLEKQTPQWFEDHAMAEGMVDYYGRLRDLVDAEPTGKVALLPHPGMENVLKRLQVMDDVVTRFKLLAIDPLLQTLKKALPEKRAGVAQQALQSMASHVEAVAQDLHQLVVKAVNYLKEPMEKAQKADLPGFLRETDKLRQRTPEWYREKGLAQAISASVSLLEQCFKTYLPSAEEKSSTEQAVVPVSSGSLLLIPAPKPSVASVGSTVSLEKLMAAEQAFDTLKADADLPAFKAQDTPRKKIGLLLPLVHNAPETMRQLAEQLHGLVKSLAPAIARLPKPEQPA